MLDAVVVGGGLFGQIIAKALRLQGRSVDVLDRNEPLAGSKPAACLMKPSWFSGLGADVYEPSLRLLDTLYGVKEITFKLRPSGIATNVYWCDPNKILAPKTRHENVISVEPGLVRTGRGEVIEAKQVIVAAGFWTNQLLGHYALRGQSGAAFMWDPSPPQAENFISVWAPYRQLVGFDRGDGYWMGDGTAIRTQNWTTEREDLTLKRCQNAIGAYPPTKKMVGIRPYSHGHKPCLLEQLSPGLWVASGGAKNGTLAAGWAAHRIMESTNG